MHARSVAYEGMIYTHGVPSVNIPRSSISVRRMNRSTASVEVGLALYALRRCYAFRSRVMK